MAILLRGLTPCAVCGKVIKDGEEALLFPHIISNESDPLWRFSDSSCHVGCAKQSPEIRRLMAITEEHFRRTGPGNRKCQVCGEEILDPEDCLMFGYLGDPSVDALARFNFIHVHKSHVASWEPATEFVEMAQAVIDDGRWAGPYLGLLKRNVEAGLHRA